MCVMNFKGKQNCPKFNSFRILMLLCEGNSPLFKERNIETRQPGKSYQYYQVSWLSEPQLYKHTTKLHFRNQTLSLPDFNKTMQSATTKQFSNPHHTNTNCLKLYIKVNTDNICRTCTKIVAAPEEKYYSNNRKIYWVLNKFQKSY